MKAGERNYGMKNLCVFLFVLIGMASVVCAGDSAQSDILVPGKSMLSDISPSKILVDVRVTDKNGNPVRGLKAEDFKLSQDGRNQDLVDFYEINRSSDGTDPRIVVFIIDDLGLPKKKYDQVRTAIRYFADRVMQPTDMVGIARTAGGGVVIQPLTSDAAQLRSSIDQWQCSIETARPAKNVWLATGISSTSFVSSCSGNG
jgi:VWFA-related protein